MILIKIKKQECVGRIFVMRKFKINVNGKGYEVEVEEIKDGVPVAAPASQPAAAPAPKAAPAASVPENATKVTAPMPGNMWKVIVKEGDEVKEGDVLCILEAMKMENEIMAPKAGKVASVNVSEGGAVSSGDVLMTIA